MTLIQCPECKCEINDEKKLCDKCGFDLLLYKQAYEKIYEAKIQELNKSEMAKEQPQIVYKTVETQANSVHKPGCPCCNSEDLTRITFLDKAVNIAMFGILGNKRKYQWHCNNCKTNW
ncbi:hypothetical protein IMSAGC019_00174 [Lachnospiraceae bacterium]|nr:hypothetical protein IMSAGC019_00174 [Lachnospiraceae bacterium]